MIDIDLQVRCALASARTWSMIVKMGLVLALSMIAEADLLGAAVVKEHGDSNWKQCDAKTRWSVCSG